MKKLLQQRKLKHDELQKELNEIANEINRQSRESSYRLQKGAITFMDFLGWKGLWQSNNRNHLETVSELIRNMEMLRNIPIAVPFMIAIAKNENRVVVVDKKSKDCELIKRVCELSEVTFMVLDDCLTELGRQEDKNEKK